MKYTILITVFLLLISNTFATELLVPSQYQTIQAAIDATVDGDIVIVEPNTYRENINFLGKAITVRSVNPSSWDTVRTTIIDGGGTGTTSSRNRVIIDGGIGWPSCVTFNEGETNNSILEGLTLTNGSGTHMNPFDSPHISDQAKFGGGILCVDSSPIIRLCNIKNNGEEYRTSGGGIALIGNCEAVISNCFITNNIANAGGAILIRSNPPEQSISEIRNCTIANNSMYSFGFDGEYEVDCRDTKPIIYNTIIWSKETRSLLIADPSLVAYSCVREAYIFDENYHEFSEPYELTETGNISHKPGFAYASLHYPPEQDYSYHLLPDSPCINAGDPTFEANGQTDIDGQPRVMAGRVDIGADEVVPEITVRKPVGGETWSAGSTHEIAWSSYQINNVNIHFSEDGGANFQPIECNIPSTGSYIWQTPATTISNQCVILIEPSITDPDVVCTNSGVFTIQPYSAGTEVESKWKSLGGDFNRTSLSENTGPELGCIKWKLEIDGAVPASITIGSENRIHIACEDGKLYTLNEDGSLLWSYDANSPLLSSPTIGPDGSVYVGSENGKLYAIDINGNLQWTHDTGGFIYSSPAVSEEGNIYVGSQDGLLYALDSDGSELWSFATDGIADLSGSILASPSIGIDDSVYIGGLYDPNLYALDPDTGALRWICTFESKGWAFASPIVAANGTIYQTLIYDPNLYAIDQNNGAIIWSVNLADPCSSFFDPNYSENYGNASGWSEPALGPDGTIYVSFDDPYLRAVDPDGNIKWITHLGTIGGFTLTVGNNGLIYAASDDGHLYVVDSDGREVSRFQSDNWLSYPVIAADDNIIVTNSRDNSFLIEYTKNTVFAISSECDEGQMPDLEWTGDLNSDSNVNFTDFAMLAEQWLNKE